MPDWLSTVNSQHVPFALLLKFTLLLCAGWALHALFRRRNPQWRVWLWRSVAVGVAVVALGSVTLPQWTWHLAILDATADRQPTTPVVGGGGILQAQMRDETAELIPPGTFDSPAPRTVDESVQAPAVSPPDVDSGFAEPWGMSVRRVLVVGWMLVAMCLLARILFQTLYARRLTRYGKTGPDSLTAAVRAAARDLSIQRSIELRVCNRFASPFVAGIRRPVIVIPRHLLHELDATQLRLVLLHELAHVHGRDVLWSFVVKSVQSLLWFHPLVWGISRAHRQSCEAVCDALAASASDQNVYMRFLARMALWTHQNRIAAPAGALGATAEITWRLRVLERSVGTRPPTARRLVAATVSVVGTVSCLSATNIALSEAPAQSTQPAVGSTPQPDPFEEVPEAEEERRESPDLTAAAIADLARLQGVWKITGNENVGANADVGLKQFLISFDGTTVATSVPPPLAYPRTFLLEADNDPKRMTFGDGDAQLYRFVGSRLQLCFNPDGGDPPADFTSGTVLTLLLLVSGEQLTAVRNGLTFLSQSQAEDGSFGSGELRGRVGITAICGLALANGGDLAPDDSYERIDRAVNYIISHQDASGFFSGPNGMLYDHGFAVWFLAGLHRSDRYRDKVRLPLQRAVDLTLNSQHADGGWRYLPTDSANTPSDLSNTSLQLRALAEARRAGFAISEECLSSGIAFFAEHQIASGTLTYTYRQGAGSFSCTVEALSALKHMGVDDGPVHENGWRAFAEYTDGTRDREKAWFLYGNLFALDALGDITDQHTYDWYREVCVTLVEGQRRDGSWRGDYEPSGPDYATALACLILLPRITVAP